MSKPESSRKSRKVKELRLWQRCLIAVLAGVIHLWGATFRWRLDPNTEKILEETTENCVVVLWHNQLFAAPAFFRKRVSNRRLAALISASGDGAWLATLLRKVGIEPVRGSSHRRGAQALRELRGMLTNGFDVAVTPDGSRGPLYSMKAGVAWLAKSMQEDVVLLSIRPTRSFRLKSWDRFHLPWPFTVIEVEIQKVSGAALADKEVEVIREDLQTRLLGMCRFAK